jgi:hypothetical protein
MSTQSLQCELETRAWKRWSRLTHQGREPKPTSPLAMRGSPEVDRSCRADSGPDFSHPDPMRIYFAADRVAEWAVMAKIPGLGRAIRHSRRSSHLLACLKGLSPFFSKSAFWGNRSSEASPSVFFSPACANHGSHPWHPP